MRVFPGVFLFACMNMFVNLYRPSEHLFLFVCLYEHVSASVCVCLCVSERMDTMSIVVLGQNILTRNYFGIMGIVCAECRMYVGHHLLHTPGINLKTGQ